MGLAGGGRLRHAGRLADLRPRAADLGQRVLRAGRRQRHLQDLRLARRDARQLQAARRGRHASTGHGLRGRTVTVDPTMVRFLRIGEGLGDNFYSISEFAAYCRAPNPFPPQFRNVDAPPARVPERRWWKFDLVGQRRQRALRDGAGARRRWRWSRWGICAARRRGCPTYQRKLRRRPAHGAGRAVLRRLLELRLLPLRQLHPRLGHLPLLHRLEVLPRAVLRPPVRVRVGRRLRGSGAAPPGRAAQDHEPAHQHDGADDRHPGPPRALQGALHARALGGLQAGHRLLPRRARRQALGGGADRSRLQRARRSGTSWARRWPTSAPASDDQINVLIAARSGCFVSG